LNSVFEIKIENGGLDAHNDKLFKEKGYVWATDDPDRVKRVLEEAFGNGNVIVHRLRQE
jgi:hypothetical protein